ncbi:MULTISPECIES: DUF3558 family protein [Amycolatopsis]|uniref:DUF3558 domain-containing protein n=2 Tax=Amycolatopsis methanolica group TaxID=2893674 RepID=A0A076MN54_AMYME|nr:MULTISPECIES: DUF3558 family protein [Amycolatopsis methanolica group]AIJ20310.1 hypothetical protein AMETH_0218 [Amycolatopsis methanolica 239]ROS40868.1 uncharacterized protein DUF3558 [Amycolatopsis thermoflava]
MRWRIAAVVAAAGLVSACTTTVSGTPQPAPGRITVAPVSSTDPCTLLTTDEAAELGLGPGTPKPAQPSYRVPPGCEWRSLDPDASLDDSLQAYYGTDQTMEEYFAAQPLGEKQIGGITWQHYSSIMGDWLCNLAVKLGEMEFVVLSGQNLLDPSKSCVVAERAAPIVAAHLPQR